MTGDTTPQQQAGVLVLEFLIEHFGDALWLLSQHADEVAQKLADAGLLCSSPVVQPKDEDGSLRSVPPAALVQIPEAVFLGVVRVSGDWENWDGNQIAAAVDRARRVLRSEGIEVVS